MTAPDILLIVIDDLSPRATSVYGGPLGAPYMDRLARRGARFDNAWTTPLCRPSRAGLMTGWYGPRIGYLSNDDRPAPDDHRLADAGTFAHALGGLGYTCGVSGKWQHDESPEELGFAEHMIWAPDRPPWTGYDGPIEPDHGVMPGRASRYWHPCLVENGLGVQTGHNDYGPDLCADWTIAFLRGPGPRFVLHNELLVHAGWNFELDAGGHVPIPGEDRAQPGSLRSSVAYLDHLIGRMAASCCRNTLILVTSDNGTTGALLGKESVEGDSPHAILVAAGPGIRPGRRRHLVDVSDFYATLVHLAGGPHGARDGLSFAPILRSPWRAGREWTYSWLGDADFARDAGWLRDGAGTLHGLTPQGEWRAGVDETRPVHAMARQRLERVIARIRG